MIEEKVKIQNKLYSRHALVALSREELLELSKKEKEFDYFIRGLAFNMNYAFVCYAYQYNDIIRKMIKNNELRISEDKDLTTYAYTILYHLNRYDKESAEYKADFGAQYESLFSSSLGLEKLKVDITDFNLHASKVFEAIASGKINEVEHDKYYIATVSFLAKYHTEYFKNSFMYPEIMGEVYYPNKKDFADKEEWAGYKKACNKIVRNIERYNKGHGKVMSKVPQGYDC